MEPTSLHNGYGLMPSFRQAVLTDRSDGTEEERSGKDVSGNPALDNSASKDEADNKDKIDIRTSLYKDKAGNPLTREEILMLKDLQRTDREVHQHEMAHIATGGAYVKGGAVYSYKTGPDGKRYAVAGEVSIDTSKENSPEKTISKMQTVRRAALAPAHPSAQDRAVAAKATLVSAEAQSELIGLNIDKIA